MDARLGEALELLRGQTAEVLGELRELRGSHAGAKEWAQAVREHAEHEQRLGALDGRASEASECLGHLRDSLKELRRAHGEVHAMEARHAEVIDSLQSAVRELNVFANRSFSELEAQKASKQEVKQLRSTLTAVRAEIQHSLNLTQANLEQGTKNLTLLREQCDAKFATKQFTEQASKKAADDALKSSVTHVNGEMTQLGRRLGVDRESRILRP
mmetsp:Transcript_124786/g.347462  ORF Transcript_124786/g.347462 Transcript_124786/m.347462 type:complete len:214 (+) Transcript_124786:1-642(+)